MLRFFQFLQEEFYIFRKIRTFGLQGAAYEENGIGTVGLVHVFEELPSHAAGGDGEDGAEIGHFFAGAVADPGADVLGEGEAAAEAGEDDGVGAGEAGELAVVAEGGDAGVFRENLGP